MRVRISVFAVLAVCLLGCAGPELTTADDYGGPVSVGKDELIGSPATYWLGSPPMIPVCFENPSTQNRSWRNAVRSDLERTWQREARVNFTGWGTCVAGQTGVHVYLGTRGTAFSYARPLGKNLSGKTASGLDDGEGVRIDADNQPYLTLHEFGHVLGFWHEEERPGYSTSSTEPACQPQDAGAADLLNGVYGASRYYGAFDLDSVMSYCSRTRTEGAPTVLSSNDIAALRRAYGNRIDGSLVSPQGNCIANNRILGETSFLWTCDEFSGNQRYSYQTQYSLLRHAASGMCISTVNGLPKLVACDPVSSNRWSFVGTMIRGWGGLCVDLQNGNTSNGTPVQMWACGALGGVNQRWNVNPSNGEIRFSAMPGKCLTVSGSLGGQAFLFDCDGRANQRFALKGDGRLELSTTGNCLDVRSYLDSQWTQPSSSAFGRPTNGMALQLFTCMASQTNQAFSLRGQLKNSSTLSCLARSVDAPGVPLVFGACDGAGVEWDYYWLRDTAALE